MSYRQATQPAARRYALRATLAASVSHYALKPSTGEGLNRQIAFYAATLAAAREAPSLAA